eukprot:7227517-Ditylum_brightwellii.AAC.1
MGHYSARYRPGKHLGAKLIPSKDRGGLQFQTTFCCKCQQNERAVIHPTIQDWGTSIGVD